MKAGADADPVATRPLQIGEWQADSVLDELRRGEQVVKLEPRKIRLLMALVRRPQQLVTVRLHGQQGYSNWQTKPSIA